MKKILFFFLALFLLTTTYSQTTIFSETWDAPASWTSNDADFDGTGWIFPENISGVSVALDPFVNVGYSECNGGTTDNFLISPAIDLSAVTCGTLELSFDLATFDDFALETMSMYIVTDLADLPTALPIAGPLQIPVGNVIISIPPIDLSAFIGQSQIFIVFRHHDSFDFGVLIVDNILLTNTTTNCIDANFTVDNVSGCLGNSFTFTDNSIGTDLTTTYDWDFGDGVGTATGIGPHSYTYTSTGSYTVTLTLNGGTDTETKVNFITVLDQPMVDNNPITESQTVCAGNMTTPIDLLGSIGGVGSASVDFEWTYTTVPPGLDIGLVSPGTGDIPAFVALNNTGSPIVATFTITPINNGCNGTPIDITITVNPQDDPTFAYSALSFCEGSGNEFLGFAASPGGTFSSSTPGFVNPITGELNFTGLTAGTYDVSYLTAGLCPNSSILLIDVIATPTVNAVANQNGICEASNTVDIIFTGTATTYDWTYTNGTATNIGVPFAGTGVILSFVTTNGTGASVNSTFTVTPSTGTCVGTPINFDISVEPSIDATFSYAATSFCLSEANPSATATNAGGVFTSAPAGLNFADAAGTIDLATSVAGNYVVTYSFGGICPTTFDFNVALGDAPFVTNPGNFIYCENAAIADILFAGGVGSQFTWTSDNTNIGIAANGNGDILSFVTATTGVQQVANIEVVPSVGTCSGAAEIFTITVNPTEDATFSYAQTSFCTANPNPFPTITGVAGGTFSAVPAGLILDVNTGEIDIASSTQNTYDITYTTTDPTCPGTFTFQIQIGVGTATINAVSNQQFCESVNTTDILFTGSVGANFTWTNDNTAIGIPASGNGDILSFMAANGTLAPIVANITVTPDDGVCPGPSTTFTITVNPVEDASFTLSAVNSCTNDLLNAPVTTITGDAGGVFSSGPGLTIDANTGAIDVTSIAGNYVVSYTTSGACPASTSVNFDLIQTPVILPFAGLNVCSGTIVPQVDLSALSTSTINWTNDNLNTGIPSLSGTGDIPSFLASNPNAGGVDEVSVITLVATNNGCSSAAQTFNFTVNALPIVGAGSDRTICEGSSITLTATGSATTFVWDNAITNGVAFFPSAGNYLYTVTGTTNGCSALDQVTINVNPAPIVNAGVDVVVCVGSQALLTASGATTLSWNNNVLNNVPFTPVMAGDYIVTGVNNFGCSAKDTLVLTIESLPIPSFTSDVTMGCVPSDITFTSSNTTNACVYTFSDGTIENGSTVTHTFTQTGVYDVTLNQVSLNGCIGSTTVPAMIVINPDPVASFTVDRPIVNMIDPSTSFENTSQGAISYEWNFGDGSSADNSFEPIHAFPSAAAGSYNVMLVAFSQFGCTDTTYADIILEESTIFYIPNSFTPNGDELNNTFNPVMYAGFDTQDYNIKIFDRWGELIFESFDASYGWDGDYGAGRGLAPGGTYTYKLVFNTPTKDEKKVIVGSVNLLR